MAKDQTKPDRKDSFAVSVHDVSPLTRGVVDTMLSDLRLGGVESSSLLVVPDHHRKGPVDHDPAFLEWLRARQNEGHEIVLHGFYHLREKNGGGLGRRLVTEHYDLAYDEARQRLARGRAMLAGFDVAGFIAPAWLLGDEAERAARDEGFAYTTRLGSVLELPSGERTDSQSLVYSVRSGWRRGASLVWNSWLASRLRGNPLMRLGLHPPDWRHAKIKAHALRLAREGARARRVIRYRDWIGA